MTPTEKRKSGNPAKQAEIQLTVKQERERKKQEKLAEYQRQMAKRRRGKLVWWTVGGVAVLAIAAVVTASIVLAPAPPPTYSMGSAGVEIEGVETFDNAADHVEGTVEYPQSPPAGGPHNAVWLNCGVYTVPQPNENAVHSMEHGAVWVTYDASALSAEDIETLKSYLPSSYALLSPYEGLDSPVVLSAWNAQLKLDSVDDERIPEFFEEYWRGSGAPEPNAICTGAMDGEGKES